MSLDRLGRDDRVGRRGERGHERGHDEDPVRVPLLTVLEVAVEDRRPVGVEAAEHEEQIQDRDGEGDHHGEQHHPPLRQGHAERPVHQESQHESGDEALEGLERRVEVFRVGDVQQDVAPDGIDQMVHQIVDHHKSGCQHRHPHDVPAVVVPDILVVGQEKQQYAEQVDYEPHPVAHKKSHGCHCDGDGQRGCDERLDLNHDNANKGPDITVCSETG